VAVLGNLSRYRDLERLGSGGMATVVLAQDTLLGREVALKRMHTAADPHGAERLRREALVGASISHPNLVSIYDVVSTDEGDVVIVMEYVAGENLGDAIAREGRVAVPETLRVLEGVATGLDAIHERGIVHRDIKPANILLGHDGAVKVADLGIAATPDRTRITTVGTVLGSFSYMAPEQLEEGPVTPAIDVYALATVAYEALSGVQAHRASTPIAVAHAIATQPAPDIREVWPQAPAAAAELLRRGMARDPRERPHSAPELVARLRSTLQDQTTRRIAARPPVAAAPAAAAGAAAAASAPRRRAPASPPPDLPGAGRAARTLIPLALLLLALGVIAAVLVAGNSSSPSPATRASHNSSTHATRHATTPHTTTAKSTPAATSTPTTSTPTSSTPTASTPTAATQPNGGAATPPSGGAGSPTAAVASFYGLAASHRYAQAWALADPVFRSQLGGYHSFVSGQSGDRQIIFHTDRVISRSGHEATVQIATTSVRNNGTSQCQGTAQVQDAGSGGWLLHSISIHCS
jgi:serine/threonine-protein kinase